MVNLIKTEVIRSEISKNFILEINGKTINAWKWQSLNRDWDNEADAGIDDQDIEKLSDEEVDEVINYLSEIEL